MALFPYSNFHDINLDWIVGKLKKAVFTINGQSPDDEGNVILPAVAGVSSVNGVGPDSLGNVTLTASDVNALPDSYSAPVQSVQGKTGNVILSASDVNAMPVGYVPPVQSVNGQTGAVVLTAADVSALPDTYSAPVDSVNGYVGAVVLDASDVNALPDTTVIPTLTSQLTNDSGFITSQQAGAVLSVNGQVGAVVLDANDVSALPDTTVIPTLTSQLINDSGYITSAQAAPVDSVNGYIGNVVLTAADVGALPDTATAADVGAIPDTVPYCVEAGTSGDWTYRKWSDGRCECWGLNTQSHAITAAMGSLYHSVNKTASLPAGLFNDAPTVFAQLRGGGYTVSVQVQNASASVITFGIVSATSQTATVGAYFYCLGTYTL